MMSVLIAIVIELPIGTNLGLLHVLWALVSGQLLVTRGALIPALANSGLSEAEVMRAWSAFAKGSWDMHRLVTTWAEQVRQDGHWERSQYGGYRVKALDLTGFFRPCLKHGPTTHYHSTAGKALKAIPLGIVGDVGRIGTQRFTLPCALVRADVDPLSEAVLEDELVRMAVQQMAEDEALTVDRGFKPVIFVKAGCTRVVLRRPKNFTARRRTAPPYRGRGRKPSRPEMVRPLPRTYRGKTIAATPPDRVETWRAPQSDVIVTAHIWSDVVLPDQPKGWDAKTRQLIKDTPWTIVLIFHPDFPQPMRLIMTIPYRLSRPTRSIWIAGASSIPRWSPNRSSARRANSSAPPINESSFPSRFSAPRATSRKAFAHRSSAKGYGLAWPIAGQNRPFHSPRSTHLLLFASRFKHD
ncbi:MAG: hypothetical protein M1546_16645 [Chloroflexi bacterium]|nr:hypothetical protein [Chloroflexota bacterium]